ncbi:hypothetical protein SAMN03159343_0976 [Klenkia marina]|uniref:MYXO-CTERM domain-containing protein n=1 Tax=Klenkia marina TaxID=1960309 RepID=A0A1G4XH19_9ACTN|nr:hypothetical protein [Klenkia marina]SCX40491.1 hypothetical protein SAMN03159343_0976 [Klenkia marina]
MRARLGWALLLLAAVFAVHGLQCMAAEPTADASPKHGVVAMQMALADGHASPEGAEAAPHVVPSAHAASGDVPAGHSAAMHALMVCLAVLAGGIGVALAALAAWLARGRARSMTRRATTAVRAVLDRHRPSLPAPEFARLCVLRI